VGNTAEDVNAILSLKGSSVNAVGCSSEEVQVKENTRKKWGPRKRN
jgi:hypothetical protein